MLVRIILHHKSVLRSMKTLAVLACCWGSFGTASTTMIRGGSDKNEVKAQGWPAGAAPLFNTTGRIAWWEGPPFGGGQWHAECQGDAEKLSKFLDGFAKIEGVKKRIVVHSGIARSFWLDPNREKPHSREIEMDWMFMVWEKDRWEFQKSMRRDISAIRDASETEPISEVHVYTGGDVDWKKVRVPKGIEVDDQQLESHGFTVRDGRVIEGSVIDLESKQPIRASMELESYEAVEQGGYVYRVVDRAPCDASGKWRLKNLPAGSFRLVARCEGFVPRVTAHIHVDDQVGWANYKTELVRGSTVQGRVIDAKKAGLADVDVRIDGALYESPEGYTAKTDDQGRFEIVNVPPGDGSIWIHRSGYTRPGLGPKIEIPSKEIELEMEQAGSLQIEVLFKKGREGGYMIHIRDAAGDKVGTWGGNGNIDVDNRLSFSDIPPGRYILYGQPNPGSADQKTKEIEIEIEGGKMLELELEAR